MKYIVVLIIIIILLIILYFIARSKGQKQHSVDNEKDHPDQFTPNTVIGGGPSVDGPGPTASSGQSASDNQPADSNASSNDTSPPTFGSEGLSATPPQGNVPKADDAFNSGPVGTNTFNEPPHEETSVSSGVQDGTGSDTFSSNEGSHEPDGDSAQEGSPKQNDPTDNSSEPEDHSSDSS